MIETVPSGTVLHGRYRIERVLGSGGFGHVYLAIDQVTSQQYALKEYLVTGTSGQEQLKHEATVLSQLHHPNLPAFQDAFIERGRYYVVLNYIEGNDLTDLIRMARQRNDIVPISRIMGWILSICDAVMFMHSQHPSFIHRDIKPDNIRIMPNGTAVLVDLGNAKAAADGARTLFFIRHQGTPGYAPPEQYPGGSGTDARSDVYALGGTLYFALTAHEPASVSARNQAIQQGQPDLPSLQERLANNPPEESPEANSARQFRLGVSKPSKPAPRHSRHLAQLGTLPPELLAQLNQVIQKAMAMRPKDRYQYVSDFAHDLRKVMAALPTPTPPPRPVDPHSTQPDLPGIYDALQAAKDNASQGSSGTNAQPAPGSPSSSSPTNCPRCGTALLPNAAFCPRCGASLGGPTNVGSTNTNSANHQTRAGDISGEQTLLITRGQLQQASAAHAQRQHVTGSSAAPVASPPQTPPTMQSGGGLPGQQRTPVTASQVPPSSPLQNQVMSHVPQGPSTGQRASSSMRFIMKPRTILLLVIVLALLIVIILLVILKTHGHTADINMPWYSLRAKVLSHGSNISIGLTSPISFTALRVWKRRSGISATSGLT